MLTSIRPRKKLLDIHRRLDNELDKLLETAMDVRSGEGRCCFVHIVQALNGIQHNSLKLSVDCRRILEALETRLGDAARKAGKRTSNITRTTTTTAFATFCTSAAAGPKSRKSLRYSEPELSRSNALPLL